MEERGKMYSTNDIIYNGKSQSYFNEVIIIWLYCYLKYTLYIILFKNLQLNFYFGRLKPKFILNFWSFFNSLWTAEIVGKIQHIWHMILNMAIEVYHFYYNLTLEFLSLNLLIFIPIYQPSFVQIKLIIMIHSWMYILNIPHE